MITHTEGLRGGRKEDELGLDEVGEVLQGLGLD